MEEYQKNYEELINIMEADAGKKLTARMEWNRLFIVGNSKSSELMIRFHRSLITIVRIKVFIADLELVPLS
jgi:hypothetical protein